MMQQLIHSVWIQTTVNCKLKRPFLKILDRPPVAFLATKSDNVWLKGINLPSYKEARLVKNIHDDQHKPRVQNKVGWTIWILKCHTVWIIFSGYGRTFPSFFPGLSQILLCCLHIRESLLDYCSLMANLLSFIVPFGQQYSCNSRHYLWFYLSLIRLSFLYLQTPALLRRFYDTLGISIVEIKIYHLNIHPSDGTHHNAYIHYTSIFSLICSCLSRKIYI